MYQSIMFHNSFYPYSGSCSSLSVSSPSLSLSHTLSLSVSCHQSLAPPLAFSLFTQPLIKIAPSCFSSFKQFKSILFGLYHSFLLVYQLFSLFCLLSTRLFPSLSLSELLFFSLSSLPAPTSHAPFCIPLHSFVLTTIWHQSNSANVDTNVWHGTMAGFSEVTIAVAKTYDLSRSVPVMQ